MRTSSLKVLSQTISALDINTEDLFLDLSTQPNISSFSPFDDVFYQSYNSDFKEPFFPLLNALSFIESNIILANNHSDCDDDVILKSGIVVANEVIDLHSKLITSSTVDLELGSNTKFESEGEIIMKAGFWVKQGAQFNASIRPCQIQLCEPPAVNKKNELNIEQRT